MVVPFGIGRVVDIIYTKDDNSEMISRLTKFCIILLGVFIIGALANFGRIYIMQTSGQFE
jgi:ATP-binding cassette subfamily B (MDR/TAP) protein 10